MISRVFGVAAVSAGLTVALAAPSWASSVHAGEFCRKSAAGTTTTASNGRQVQCSYGGSADPYYRYRNIAGTTMTGGGAGTTPVTTTSSSGSSSGQRTAAGIPSQVNSGSGGAADRQDSDLPWAVGGLGVLVAGGSTVMLVRRRPS